MKDLCSVSKVLLCDFVALPWTVCSRMDMKSKVMYMHTLCFLEMSACELMLVV